jgi:hypothetical protein
VAVPLKVPGEDQAAEEAEEEEEDEEEEEEEDLQLTMAQGKQTPEDSIDARIPHFERLAERLLGGGCWREAETLLNVILSLAEALPVKFATKHSKWAERVCLKTQVEHPPVVRILLTIALKLRPHPKVPSPRARSDHKPSLRGQSDQKPSSPGSNLVMYWSTNLDVHTRQTHIHKPGHSFQSDVGPKPRHSAAKTWVHKPRRSYQASVGPIPRRSADTRSYQTNVGLTPRRSADTRGSKT